MCLYIYGASFQYFLVDEGVVVYKIVNDSPAHKAGLKKGDVIIKLGNNKVENLADFRYELYKYDPLDKVTVTYIRDNKEQITELLLGKSE